VSIVYELLLSLIMNNHQVE